MSQEQSGASLASHKQVFLDQINRQIKAHETSLQKKLKKKYPVILLAFQKTLDNAWDRFSNRFNAPLPSDPDLEFYIHLAADMHYLSIFGQHLMIPKATKHAATIGPTIFDTDEDPAV